MAEQYVGVVFRGGPGRLYSYVWRGEKRLHVGERVVVPPTAINEFPSFANVSVIYASREDIQYKGQLAEIMERMEEDG